MMLSDLEYWQAGLIMILTIRCRKKKEGKKNRNLRYASSCRLANPNLYILTLDQSFKSVTSPSLH